MAAQLLVSRLDTLAGAGAALGALAEPASRGTADLRGRLMDIVEAGVSVCPADATWEDPPRWTSAAGAPVLSIAGFEGPLDWLLEMARARKIDLARLSIAALIEAFGAALEEALAAQENGPVLMLARWGDWLVMAARLAELRSRLLLPGAAPSDTGARHAGEALRRRVLDRASVAATADWLEQRPQLGRDVFARGRAEAGRAPRGGGRTELLRACLVALRVPEQTQTHRIQPLRLWPVADAIGRIRQLLARLPQGGALEEFVPEINTDTPDRRLRGRAALAATLLAGLELARDGAVRLEQTGSDGPVRIGPLPACGEAGPSRASAS